MLYSHLFDTDSLIFFLKSSRWKIRYQTLCWILLSITSGIQKKKKIAKGYYPKPGKFESSRKCCFLYPVKNLVFYIWPIMLCIAVENIICACCSIIADESISTLIRRTGKLFLDSSTPRVINNLRNPLSVNPKKWSNTLKQFIGNSQRIVECVWPFWRVGA